MAVLLRAPGRIFLFAQTAMLAAFVQVMAVPASQPQVAGQGIVPPEPDFSDNNWAHNWHELITDSSGPCIANKLTNCWCSSNFAEDECDNTTTPAAGVYGEYEDCSVRFAQPIDVFVPLFSTEPYVTKYYKTRCAGYRWRWCVSHRWIPGGSWCWGRQYYTYSCQRPFQGGDDVTVDAWGANKPKDTHDYNGELAENGMNGVKATHMIWRSDRDTGHPGFKICAVNPFVNPGGHAPTGGASPDGVSPPYSPACACGTNAAGTNPGGAHENPVSEGSGDNCYSNPAWPCDRDPAEQKRHYDKLEDRDESLPLSNGHDVSLFLSDTTEAASFRGRYLAERCPAVQEEVNVSMPHHIAPHDMFCHMIKTKQENPGNITHYSARPTGNDTFDLDPGPSWQFDVRRSLTRNNVKTSVGCCVCQGGWVAGYDPQGDMASEEDLGEMTRPECIIAAKAVAGANAASIDDTATETVTGTCYAETNAHYSPAGWTSGSPRQACLFG